MVPEYQMPGDLYRCRHSPPRLGNGRRRASTGAWMCFKDIVITTVVCPLTRSFTVAVGVEVAGALPLVVVLVGVQLHAFMGVLYFLFVFVFSVFICVCATGCPCAGVCRRCFSLVDRPQTCPGARAVVWF
jgi:hypothetical protein